GAPHEYVCVALASDGGEATLSPHEGENQLMTNSNVPAQSPGRTRPSRVSFAPDVGLTAAGCVALILATTSQARAQTADTPPAAEGTTEDVATVIVSGIRHGIEDAIALKRDSTSIVEAISAEDIGKLP